MKAGSIIEHGQPPPALWPAISLKWIPLSGQRNHLQKFEVLTRVADFVLLSLFVPETTGASGISLETSAR